MADFTFYKAHSDWEYNLAINIIAWLYAAAMLAVMLFRSKVDTFCGYTPIVMLILDVIMTILVLIGGIATVARCNTQGIYKGVRSISVTDAKCVFMMQVLLFNRDTLDS